MNARVEHSAFVSAVVHAYGLSSALARARRLTHDPAYRKKPQWLTRAIEIMEATQKEQGKCSTRP